MRHPDEARVAAWRTACDAGDCRYPFPTAPARSRQEATGCPGYVGTLHLEQGSSVMRYRPCRRFDAWWPGEKLRLAAKRDGKRIPASAPSAPPSWTEGR